MVLCFERIFHLDSSGSTSASHMHRTFTLYMFCRATNVCAIIDDGETLKWVICKVHVWMCMVQCIPKGIAGCICRNLPCRWSVFHITSSIWVTKSLILGSNITARYRLSAPQPLFFVSATSLWNWLIVFKGGFSSQYNDCGVHAVKMWTLACEKLAWLHAHRVGAMPHCVDSAVLIRDLHP